MWVGLWVGNLRLPVLGALRDDFLGLSVTRAQLDTLNKPHYLLSIYSDQMCRPSQSWLELRR